MKTVQETQPAGRRHVSAARLIRYTQILASAVYWRARAGKYLIGSEFDALGRRSSLALLKQGDVKGFLAMLSNPVSIVRYFEFDFALRAVTWNSVRSALDLSSPRLLFAYLLKRNPSLSFDVVNPDRADLDTTRDLLHAIGVLDRSSLVSSDAIGYRSDGTPFDVATSISVLEHIPGSGDSEALATIWHLLRPGGKLVITVPCARCGWTEWRDHDEYGLNSPEKDGRYFFQRIYDASSVQRRLVDAIGVQPNHLAVFGEKQEGIYMRYRDRWIEYGLRETVKDPFHIVKDYRRYPDIDSLPGIGVCGMVFSHPKRDG